MIPILFAALLASTGNDGAAAAAPQDAPPSYPQWTGALTLGGTWTDGNTENETFGGVFHAERRAEKDRWTFDLFWNYGKTSTDDDVPATVDDRTTVNNSGAGVKYDYFWSDELYAFGNGSTKKDHLANLELRYVLGTGIGYQWTETEKLKWGTEAGLSYVDEDFDPILVDMGPPAVFDEPDTEFIAARVASNLTWQLSKSATFEQVTEVLPSLEDSEDLIAKFDNRLKLNITGKWIAQIQYVLDYDDSTPRTVEEADHRIVVGLGWDFGS